DPDWRNSFFLDHLCARGKSLHLASNLGVSHFRRCFWRCHRNDGSDTTFAVVRRLIESIERMQLAASSGRQVDGIWIGSFRDSPEDLARVEQALLLVKQHSPVHYSCIINNLERIWISVLRHIGAHGTATRCAWRSPCASPRKTMSSSRNGLTG